MRNFLLLYFQEIMVVMNILTVQYFEENEK